MTNFYEKHCKRYTSCVTLYVCTRQSMERAGGWGSFYVWVMSHVMSHGQRNFVWDAFCKILESSWRSEKRLRYLDRGKPCVKRRCWSHAPAKPYGYFCNTMHYVLSSCCHGTAGVQSNGDLFVATRNQWLTTKGTKAKSSSTLFASTHGMRV